MAVKKSRAALDEAIKIILAGGIIICPTDTVYGFIADAANQKAVEKIFEIKKRPRTKPLAVFVKDIKMAKELTEINAKQEKILTLRLRSGQAKYWPGKYTFVLKSKKMDIGCPSNLVMGKDGTIALRIPKYKFLQGLLKKINKPLAQTSANISGRPASTKINDVITQFSKSIGTYDIPILIIDGEDLPKSKPSTIIDLSKKKIKILRK